MGDGLSTLGNALQSGLIEAECPLSSHLIPTCQIRLTGQSMILPQRADTTTEFPLQIEALKLDACIITTTLRLSHTMLGTFAGMYL